MSGFAINPDDVFLGAITTYSVDRADCACGSAPDGQYLCDHRGCKPRSWRKGLTSIEGVEGSQKWRAPHAQVVVDGKLGTLWVLVSDSLFRFRLENIPSLTMLPNLLRTHYCQLSGDRCSYRCRQQVFLTSYAGLGCTDYPDERRTVIALPQSASQALGHPSAVRGRGIEGAAAGRALLGRGREMSEGGAMPGAMPDAMSGCVCAARCARSRGLCAAIVDSRAM